MSSATSFWDNVKVLIKEQNTTQEWLARKIGVPLKTFQGWIMRKAYPGGDEMFLIAQTLDVSVEYLMTGKELDNTKLINEIKEQIDGIKDKLDKLK
jgi:transcriptional regulator with XRE-family HTH domain